MWILTTSLNRGHNIFICWFRITAAEIRKWIFDKCNQWRVTKITENTKLELGKRLNHYMNNCFRAFRVPHAEFIFSLWFIHVAFLYIWHVWFASWWIDSESIHFLTADRITSAWSWIRSRHSRWCLVPHLTVFHVTWVCSLCSHLPKEPKNHTKAENKPGFYSDRLNIVSLCVPSAYVPGKI